MLLKNRGSGILLPVTSLPSPFGIGDLGPAAFRFAEFLHAAGQKYWQILPLNPTTPACDNSPYLSTSAFAGNTGLISPEYLVRDGYLEDFRRDSLPDFPEHRVDYPRVLRYKRDLFQRAFDQRGEIVQDDPEYLAFCSGNKGWLEDYALFVALDTHYGGSWNTWPGPVRCRDPARLADCRREFNNEIEREKFLQYLFFRQWGELHQYCNARGIRILGDLPIYVHFNSADVWVHPELFRLDTGFSPQVIAGVPPDYFSRTGQIWRNPLYRWEEHERTGFSWWIDRFRQNFSLLDIVRIDHFRGLVAYYEIPAGARDAIAGRWVRAPAESFLQTMQETFTDFPVIAEDLGIITPDVSGMMMKFGLTGMKVLQFAFTDDTPTSPHAPHNLSRDTVLYTGTHDNPPLRGWFEQHISAADKQRLFRYLGEECTADEVPGIFLRLAMMSVANTSIIPLQDILGLGDDARINTPGIGKGNWEWRVGRDQIGETVADTLHDLTRIYGRA